MKTPEEIAREIVDAARCPCARGHELEEEDLYCPGCLRSMIAAAIVAERTPGTTGGIRQVPSGTTAPLTTAAIDTTGADLLVVGPKWFRRDGGGEWKEVPRTPHSCQLHRATGGASDCGLSPCEESKVHADRGPPRPVNVRRVNPLPAAPAPAHTCSTGSGGVCLHPGCAPAPACARCGGSGEIVRWVGSDFAGYSETNSCPECRGKP